MTHPKHPPVEQQFPIGPLLPYLVDSAGDPLGETLLDQMTGLNTGYLIRRGWLRENEADFISCRIAKVPPMLIWGDQWFERLGEQVSEPARVVAADRWGMMRTAS